MTQRFAYVQCGNCIDVYDTLTGNTVAMLNVLNRDAQDVFTDWHAKHARKPAQLAGVAIAVGVSLSAWYVLIWALTGSN